MQVFYDLDLLPKFKNAVLTIGSFDGVHAGHRRILERVELLAREVGGESIVVTFDPHPRLVLRPEDTDFRLINSLPEKLELLKLAGVSVVVVVPFSRAFSAQTADEYIVNFLVEKFSPKIIVIGYDHHFGQNRVGNIDFLIKNSEKYGFSVVEIPKHEVDDLAVSSTKIRKAVETHDILTANKLLGHPFLLTGKVVEGDKIGRTIGFPTANLDLEFPQKLLPSDGIYAARAKVSDSEKWISGMLYIGHRPSISGEKTRRIEVNLLDFSADIYGKNLTVEVIDFIRGDKKMDSLADLQAQIEADKLKIVAKLNAVEPQKQDNFEENLPKPEAIFTENEQNPKVAIVILNYNTRRHLESFLPSVVATKYSNFEIIVADNASPDDSVSWLNQHYSNIQVIEFQQNSGFAGGYNDALANIEADYFVLLNSDVEVTENWLTPIIKRMENEPNIAIAQPKILAEKDKTRFEYAGAAGGWIDYLGYPFCRGRIFENNEIDAGQYDAPQDCFWAAGAALFIRAKIWRDFGGFDADYFAHNEEIDLCWRVKRAGFRVICEPKSVVFHLGGGTLEYENPRKIFLNFRNSLYSILKNESTAKLFWLIPARFLLDGLAGLVFLAKGKPRSVRAIVEAHFSFYHNFRKTLAKRQKVAQLIENQRIAPENRAGIYPKSIVWVHKIGQKKHFSELFNR